MKMQAIFKTATLLGAIALLSACSTIANGKNQMVSFTTMDASGDIDGANCTATGGSNYAVSETFTTPAEVHFPRSGKALKVLCEKPGYETGTKVVDGDMEGATAGNILLGGFVGLGVDAMTGAIHKYPDTVVILMEKIGGAVATSGDTISK